jgi:hypothetical protein
MEEIAAASQALANLAANYLRLLVSLKSDIENEKRP